MVEILETWWAVVRCPECGALLSHTGEDLYSRGGVVLLTCRSCEREFDYARTLALLPPFQRERALARERE